MLNRTVTLSQLTRVDLKSRENQYLESVIARGQWTDVVIIVLGNHSTTSSSGYHFPTAKACNLIVLGEPFAVVEKLVDDLGVDTGLIEPVITMTMSYARSWVQQWGDEHEKKADAINYLDLFTEQANHCLQSDRHHFSSAPMLSLLSAINRSINLKNATNLTRALHLLSSQPEMRLNPA